MTCEGPEASRTLGILLRGIDGANPLGFLASLGTLRVAGIVWPDRRVSMEWTQHAGAWRPVVHVGPAATEDEFTRCVHRYLRRGVASTGDAGPNDLSPEPAEAFPYFAFDKNTSKIPPLRFREIALEASAEASLAARAYADFVAAFGCEACTDDDYVQDTALRTMSGAGWQHFLATMLTLVEDVEPEHVRQTLFERWSYNDPLKNHSMRWDPSDDKRHAYQWTDPTDSSQREKGGMWGANRLAIEGLPLLPTMPSHRLETTGFRQVDGRGPVWTWPIWSRPISIDTCRSLLALGNLQKRPLDRKALAARGVAEVFSSRRISVRYYRNFTPAQAV